VVNGLWYRLERRTDDGATDIDESLQTDLVRYMLDTSVDPPSPITASREVVVENAIDFQVWFRAAVGAGGAAFTMDVADDLADDSTVTLVPGRRCRAPGAAMRSAIVRLTVRTRLRTRVHVHGAVRVPTRRSGSRRSTWRRRRRSGACAVVRDRGVAAEPGVPQPV